MTPSSDPRPGRGRDSADCPATRREFVKTSARAVGAGALILLIGESREAEGQEAQTAVADLPALPEGYDVTQHSYVIVIDRHRHAKVHRLRLLRAGLLPGERCAVALLPHLGGALPDLADG
ncbi:MAG: hypothetical protein ACYSUF_06640 [Planctomycetota bacterium]|jgi:hypothetical protein